MRVLFLGHCSYYTLANFTIALKKQYRDFTITVADPVKPGGVKITNEEGKVFDKVISLPSRKEVNLAAGNKINAIVYILKDHYNRSKIIRNIIRFRTGAVMNQIREISMKDIYAAKLKQIFESYDVIHFHYLSPDYLAAIHFIPQNKKILMTFWGSDLYQVSGVKNYKKQFEGLKRADLITVNSLELKETVLAKFGRDLSPKIRYADFSVSKSRIDRIEMRCNEGTIKNFKRKNGIEEGKKLIILGYSASSKQKHTEILRILDEIESEIKQKFYVVIPMTYGLEYENENYLEKVKEVCRNVSFGSKILTDYMAEEELTDFIISSEIKLNLRETDAINAAMLESLFAGNIVVNGAWLQYGKLRRLGLYCKEIENLSELKTLIPSLINNFDNEKSNCRGNAEIIKKNFLYENTISDWKKIYDELKK
ncbi:MAG TPA: TDP-N-acetylfucosamine:lipid II N-acetylfucosaminyltransferase [Ignavibacteria bacterium]|nr:TDP-N-acetylfucosamine:lipid II N-acetylfucosaminyltransferase [Ignavibacteria bacterium]